MPSQAEVIQALQNASNGQGLDPMVPAPQSPADVYAGASPFASALGLPDALKALKGQFTPEEAQGFALTSAMGLLPGAKAETAVAKGAEALAGKGTLTDLGKTLWNAAKANDFQPLARVGQQNIHPQTFADPIEQELSSVLDEQSWLKGAPKVATPEGYSLKQVPGAASDPQALNDYYIHDPNGKKIGELTHNPEVVHDPAWSTPEHWHLGVDNMPDMADKVYSSPQEALKAGQLFHEQGLTGAAQTKAQGKIYPPIDENAISNALAKNPGASIFDVAGTNVEGPSSEIKPWSTGTQTFHPKIFSDIPREAGAAPLRASILGRSENLVHGTRASFDNWTTPTGDVASGDALRLPDDELGVHFGNPRAAQEFSGSSTHPNEAPRQYPVVVATNNPLRLPDLGSWQAPKVVRALRKEGFPQEELDNLGGIGDVRNYLTNKGYDSIVYNNKVEDIGHDSYIKFAPSPEAPNYVAGVRSPFAAFDPSKIMRPELAAGIGGAAITPQIQEYIKALQGNGGQQNQ